MHMLKINRFSLVLFFILSSVLADSRAAFREYNGTLRPKRDRSKPMDNVSPRLEGIHLTRTCPPLVEQKVKNTPPRACTYYKISSQLDVLKSKIGCDGVACCEKARVTCAFVSTDKQYYTRLLLRPDPALLGSPLTCQWEGCPLHDYFGLTGYQESRPTVDPCVNQCPTEIACNRSCPSTLPTPTPGPGPGIGGS